MKRNRNQFQICKEHNRVQNQTPPALTWNKYDENNRLLYQTSNDASYAYDKNGNTVSKKMYSNKKEQNTQYIFDGADRLIEVVRDTEKVQYLYDADGTLVQRKHILGDTVQETRKYKNFAGQTISELDDKSKTVSIYTRTPNGGILRQRNLNFKLSAISHFHHSAFYIQDPKGNVIQIIDYTGTKIAHYDYDSWGNKVTDVNVIPTLKNVFGYGEAFTDPITKLVKFGQRWYDPSIGRWISEDRYSGSIADPTTLHRYLYARDNPVNYVDKTGLSADKWDTSIKGVVNEWYPTQPQARLAAEAFALELDLQNLPQGANLPPINLTVQPGSSNPIANRYYVSGPEMHDIGPPHYHVYSPTGVKIEGHFFFGIAPPRKEKSIRESRERHKEPNPYSRTATALGYAAGGTVAAYFAYRAIRMLPSLLPPLWWTIPINAAAP